MSAKSKDVVFVTSAAVKDKPVVALDKAQAYILMRSDMATTLQLMKVPSAEDQAAYDQMRADAFAEAREKYVKKLASYERTKKLADSLKKKGSGSTVTVPEKPIEPTETNFEFTAFGLLSGVSIGPINRFAKQEGGASVYLQAVTPGVYRIYGPMSVVPNGPVMGTCLCMGSVSFEARAGEIADMGTLLVKPEGVATEAEGIRSLNFQLVPATADMAVDARLKDVAIRPAAYRPIGKLPNYYGIEVGRIAAMPGVIGYDRDRIVDLTATGGARN
nr:hypothetical protein [Sphingomonas colocasiae]